MTDPASIIKGMRFTHARQLDTSWRPGPGQKYTEGPKAQMEISSTRGTVVYYRALGAKHGQFIANVEEMAEGGSIVGQWLES